MKGDAPLPLRLLVVSRVIASADDTGVRFQGLDGRYIDGIAKAFASTVVAAQVVRSGQHEAYDAFARYEYRFGAPNLSILALPAPRPASPGILRTAWKLVRQAWALRGPVGRCDLAFVFLPSYAGSFGALWCRAKRRPYACYLGGDWVGYSPHAFRWSGIRRYLIGPYAWANGFLERCALDGAALLVVSGEELLARLAGAGRPVIRTEPLTPFTTDDFFEREDTCTGPAVRLVFVGALLPGKGLQYLIEALAELPGCSLQVAGTGREPFAGELRALAERHGVAARVTWHGYVADPLSIRHLYRGGDIFVLPTLSEGAPRVVWEAMSQSLPVVISDIPPVRAVLTDGVDAVLAPPADAHALAAAIDRVRTDGDLRRRLIAKSRETARRRLGRDPAAQAIALLREHVVPQTDASR